MSLFITLYQKFFKRRYMIQYFFKDILMEKTKTEKQWEKNLKEKKN